MLYHIYYASLFITLGFCLYCYNSLDKNFKWLLPYFIFSLVFETANELNWLTINHSNSWASNLEEMLECILCTYFITSLSDRSLYKRRVYLVGGVIVALSVIDMLFIQGFWQLNTFAIVLQFLFILILIGIYYYDTLDKAEEGINLLKHPPFLVVTGLLFYFLAKFFFYISYSYMVYKNNYDFIILAMTIPGLANLLLNSMLIYTFLCIRKAKRMESLS